MFLKIWKINSQFLEKNSIHYTLHEPQGIYTILKSEFRKTNPNIFLVISHLRNETDQNTLHYKI